MRSGISMIAVLGFLALALVFSGCVTNTLKGETIGQDGSSDAYKYVNRAIVPPFGKLAETTGKFSYVMNPDGTWEVLSGLDTAGIDASGQIEALRVSVEALAAMVQDLAPVLQLLATPETTIASPVLKGALKVPALGAGKK